MWVSSLALCKILPEQRVLLLDIIRTAQSQARAFAHSLGLVLYFVVRHWECVGGNMTLSLDYKQDVA